MRVKIVIIDLLKIAIAQMGEHIDILSIWIILMIIMPNISIVEYSMGRINAALALYTMNLEQMIFI